MIEKTCHTCINRSVFPGAEPCHGCVAGGAHGAWTPDPELPQPVPVASTPRRSLDDATGAEWSAAARDYFRRIDKTVNPAPAPDLAVTMEEEEAFSALGFQVAGDHYKGKKIQPVEYISANNLNFLEGCIVKRITRWRDKEADNRFQDLEKIKHEVDLLIEMEKKHGR